MKPKIKLIIFDAYGVVLSGGYPNTCKYLAKKFKRDWQEIYKILYTKYFNQAAEKKITQGAAWEKAAKEVDIPLSAKELKKIHYGFMGVNRPVISLAKRMSNNYEILLLSKNTRSQFKDINNLFPIIKTVFGKNRINTWEYDLPKAGKETMDLVLDKFNVLPTEVVISDDQEVNLIAPKEMGMKTILYKNFKQFKKEIEKCLN